MPQDARTRRLTRPSSAAERSSGAGVAPPTLVSLLAHTTRLVDLLPPLHQHALDVTGGSRLLLFEHNPRNGVLQATSGFGLDAFPTEPVGAGARRGGDRLRRVCARHAARRDRRGS